MKLRQLEIKFLELKDDKTYLKEILHNGMIKAREKI